MDQVCTYRGFSIHRDPPPIPGGNEIAWRFATDDVEDDTDPRHGFGASLGDCMSQIDTLIAEGR